MTLSPRGGTEMPPSRATLKRFVPAGDSCSRIPSLPRLTQSAQGLELAAAPLGSPRGALGTARAPRPSRLRGGRPERARVPVAWRRTASCPAGVRALWRRAPLASEMMRVWRRAAPAPRYSLPARLRALRGGRAPRQRGAERSMARPAAGRRLRPGPGPPLRLLLLLGVLLLRGGAAGAEPCQAPQQWEGRTVFYEHGSGRNTRAAVSYDGPNQRLRILEERKALIPCKK